MKKIPVLLIALLLFCGCGKQEFQKTPDTAPKAPDSFTANLTVSYDGNEMTATMVQNSFASYSFDMLSPAALEPMALSIEGGLCTVTYNDLRFETNMERYPQTAFCSVVADILDSLPTDTSLTPTFADGVWTYTGKTDTGEYVLTQNADTGAWQTLSVNSIGLHIIFDNFT